MRTELSKRQKLMLAALASEEGAGYAPVQVQKLFFLLDENIADAVGGRQFAFEPYDYGPFDKSVYHELDALQRLGYVNITPTHPASGRRLYSLTPSGFAEGNKVREKFHPKVRDYMSKVATWVRTLSFEQLVGSIYKAYPHMRENSIFQD